MQQDPEVFLKLT